MKTALEMRLEYIEHLLKQYNIEYRVVNPNSGHMHCYRKSDSKLFQYYAGTGKIQGISNVRGSHALVSLLTGKSVDDVVVETSSVQLMPTDDEQRFDTIKGNSMIKTDDDKLTADDFRAGEYILYQNGNRFELGKIKRLCDDGAFVWYSSGETAAKTPYECMHKIVNSHVISHTILGGAALTDQELSLTAV